MGAPFEENEKVSIREEEFVPLSAVTFSVLIENERIPRHIPIIRIRRILMDLLAILNF